MQDVETFADVETCGFAGNQISVLHSAVEHEINSPNVVKACVAARADVNFRDGPPPPKKSTLER